MVQRYAHLSADQLAQWVQPMTALASKTADSCNLAAVTVNGEEGKPLKALRLLVRPAGIEPATPAFGVLPARHSPL